MHIYIKDLAMVLDSKLAITNFEFRLWHKTEKSLFGINLLNFLYLRMIYIVSIMTFFSLAMGNLSHNPTLATQRL